MKMRLTIYGPKWNSEQAISMRRSLGRPEPDVFSLDALSVEEGEYSIGHVFDETGKGAIGLARTESVSDTVLTAKAHPYVAPLLQPRQLEIHHNHSLTVKNNGRVNAALLNGVPIQSTTTLDTGDHTLELEGMLYGVRYEPDRTPTDPVQLG